MKKSKYLFRITDVNHTLNRFEVYSNKEYVSQDEATFILMPFIAYPKDRRHGEIGFCVEDSYDNMVKIINFQDVQAALSDVQPINAILVDKNKVLVNTFIPKNDIVGILGKLGYIQEVTNVNKYWFYRYIVTCNDGYAEEAMAYISAYNDSHATFNLEMEQMLKRHA